MAIMFANLQFTIVNILNHSGKLSSGCVMLQLTTAHHANSMCHVLIHYKFT